MVPSVHDCGYHQWIMNKTRMVMKITEEVQLILQKRIFRIVVFTIGHTTEWESTQLSENTTDEPTGMMKGL